MMGRAAERRRQRHGRSQGGFTLIELLVTLAVTVIGLAGLMSLHVAMMKGNRTASNTTEASVIGQETLEELRSMSLASIATTYGALPIIDVEMDPAPGKAGRLLTYKRYLSVNPVSGNLVWMRIAIVWADDGADPDTVDDQYRHELALEVIRTSLEAQ